MKKAVICILSKIGFNRPTTGLFLFTAYSYNTVGIPLLQMQPGLRQLGGIASGFSFPCINI